MVVKDFLYEFKDGFISSAQGFLAFYKLDRPQNAIVAAQPRASSTEPQSS